MSEFKIKPDDIRPLLEWDGPAGCIATDRITVDGCSVGYLCREEPIEDFPDSGWRFFEGGEDEAYIADPSNSGIYSLNTICNYSPDIIPLLTAPVGSAFMRDSDGSFIPDED